MPRIPRRSERRAAGGRPNDANRVGRWCPLPVAAAALALAGCLAAPTPTPDTYATFEAGVAATNAALRSAAPPTPLPPSPTAAAVPTPPPTDTPVATPTLAVGRFAGAWFHNFGTMELQQDGGRVIGTYRDEFTRQPGSVEGTVTGRVVTGTWSSAGAAGPVTWTLSADGTTFDGAFEGAGRRRWCGARTDTPFPDGCSFAGVWSNQVNDGSPCTMNLTRVNRRVIGTYCAGRIEGTVGAPAAAAPVAVLEGTWFVQGFPPGPFTFYLLGHDAQQFQGNWRGTGADEWCGWRAGARLPSPCFRR